jgi:hypothetical protein
MRKCWHTAVSGKYVGFASDLTNLGKLCAAKPLHTEHNTVRYLRSMELRYEVLRTTYLYFHVPSKIHYTYVYCKYLRTEYGVHDALFVSTLKTHTPIIVDRPVLLTRRRV